MNHQDSNEARQDDNSKPAQATTSGATAHSCPLDEVAIGVRRHQALNSLGHGQGRSIGAHLPPNIVVAGQNVVTVSKVETIGDLLVVAGIFAKIVGAELPFVANRLAITSDQLTSAVIDSGKENIAHEIADLLLCVGTIAAMCNVTADDLRDALKEVTEYRATESINRAVKEMMVARGMAEL